MGESEAGIAAKDIVSKIKKDGDPVDATKRISGRVTPGALTVEAALALPALVEASASNPSLHWILTYPQYSAFSGVVLGAAYGYSRWKEGRNRREAESLQDDFRELTGESVDLVRIRKNKLSKKGPVMMRWYGLEEKGAATINTGGMKDRLSSLIEIAETAGIDEIAMGTTAVREILGRNTQLPQDLAQYGRVVNGGDFITEAKKLRKRIIDSKADPKVLVTTLDQARELRNIFQGKGDLYHSLSEIIGDQQIALLLGMWQQGKSKDDATKLRNLLGEKIARDYGEMYGKISRVVPLNPSRSHDFYRVVDGQLTGLTVPEDGEDGRVIPPRDLYSLVDLQADPRDGGNPLEMLLQRIYPKKSEADEKEPELLAENNGIDREFHGGSEINREFYATIALYQIILSDLRDDEIASLQDRVGSNVRGQKHSTLYQRLGQEPPRTVPFLKRRGKGATDETATLTYDNKGKLRRYVAAGVLTAALGTAAGATGGSLSYYEDQVLRADGYEWIKNEAIPPEEREKVAEVYAELHGVSIEEARIALQDKDIGKNPAKVQAYIYAQPAWGDIMRSLDAALSKHNDFEEAVATAALEAGIPLDVLKQIGASDLVDRDWVENKAKKFRKPASVSIANYSSIDNLGDVSTESNYELYKVTQLGNVSPAGYWYNDLFNKITVDSSSAEYPFTDAGTQYDAVSGGQLTEVEVALDPSDVSDKILFKVDTPYAEDAGMASLPIKSGTRIVAARFVDREDPSKVIPVEIVRNSVTGVYKARIPSNTSQLDLPVLEYYLAEAPEEIIQSDGDMEIKGSFPEPNHGITPEAAAQVKAALGLPPTATEEDVAAAVRDRKSYSYTPVANNGGERRDSGDATADQVIARIAAAYASFPEANCNIAARVTLVATGGKGNLATGYRVGNDGSINQLDAHAWVQEGPEVVDNTPRGFDVRAQPPQQVEVVENPGKKTLETVRDLGPDLTGAAVVALLGVAAYRRRRELGDIIARAEERYKEHIIEKTILDRDTLLVLNMLRFAPEGTPITAKDYQNFPSFDEGKFRGVDEMKKIMLIYPAGMTEEQWQDVLWGVADNVSEDDFDKEKITTYLGRIRHNWDAISSYISRKQSREDALVSAKN